MESKNNKERLNIIKENDGYWRVVITSDKLNRFDPWMFAELNVLMDKMEKDEKLKVVVFESGNEEFFMGHHDVENRLKIPNQEGAKPFFYEWPNFVSRLSNCRVISIAKVRGRAWAQGFEFALACDMRFASKEKAQFGLVEAGAGSLPGGGGIEWLCSLVGRSRALEIIASADAYNAELGERYGFINRAIPDAELDEFVDKYAKRIARNEKKSLYVIKKLVNARAGVPSNGDLFTSNYILHTVDQWPEGIEHYKRVAAQGFNTYGEFELNLGSRITDPLPEGNKK